MTIQAHLYGWLLNAWDVMVLFIIPIGGGIPAGVILARSRGFGWLTMLALYFVSDVILALIFEPVMLLIVYLAKRSALLTRWIAAMKQVTNRTIANFGANRAPLSLILLSFAADPMTGRSAALAAGHGFVTGWLLAIIGDLFFFVLLMVSTLWLNQVLGDGTWTVVIITVAMLAIPAVWRRARSKWRTTSRAQ